MIDTIRITLPAARWQNITGKTGWKLLCTDYPEDWTGYRCKRRWMHTASGLRIFGSGRPQVVEVSLAGLYWGRNDVPFSRQEELNMAFDCLAELLEDVLQGPVTLGNLTRLDIAVHVPISPVWLCRVMQFASHPDIKFRAGKQSLFVFHRMAGISHVMNVTLAGSETSLCCYDATAKRNSVPGGFTRLEVRQRGEVLRRKRAGLSCLTLSGTFGKWRWESRPIDLERAYNHARTFLLKLKNLDAPPLENYLPETLKELNQLAETVQPAEIISPEDAIGKVKRWRAERDRLQKEILLGTPTKANQGELKRKPLARWSRAASRSNEHTQHDVPASNTAISIKTCNQTRKDLIMATEANTLEAPPATKAKEARPGDLFQLVIHSGVANIELDKLRRKIHQPKRDTFSRSELLAGEINIAAFVRARKLKPLQATSPEIAGLTIPEILDAFLPDKARPVELLQAAFRLTDNPLKALPEPLRSATEELDGMRWQPALVERIIPALTPACLLPLLEALDHYNSGQGSRSNVSKLAGAVLHKTPPERLAGPAALPAVSTLLEKLEEPRLVNSVPMFAAILAAIMPPKSAQLYHAIRSWERSGDADARIAAEEAYYRIFIAA